jgi:hypothetical protein
MTAGMGYVCARAGDTAGARLALDELQATSAERYVSPSLFAQVHASLGERAAALNWLQKAREARAADLAWLGVRPVFDSLRAEPGFRVLADVLHSA